MRLINEERVKVLEDIINDLTLALEMHINGYPFDEHHKIKQLRLIDEASKLIGKPRTIEELKEMIQNIKDKTEPTAL